MQTMNYLQDDEANLFQIALGHIFKGDLGLTFSLICT